MIWHKFKQEFLNELKGMNSNGENESIFYLIVEHFTGIYRPNNNFLEQKIPQETLEELNGFVSRLLKHEPIQHILGYTYFDDLKLKVSSDVLIPRQETEELIYYIKENVNYDDFKAIDLGTGSGAIPIALAKHYPNASITAIDISEKALTIAQENAKNNHVNVNFLKANILNLEQDFADQLFHLIISNPPYIAQDFQSEMPKNVTEFEPSLALFAPQEDVLLFYRKILKFAQSHLHSNGFLFFEINEFYKDKLEHLAKEMNFKVDSKKDLNGNWRMMKCTI